MFRKFGCTISYWGGDFFIKLLQNIAEFTKEPMVNMGSVATYATPTFYLSNNFVTLSVYHNFCIKDKYNSLRSHE